MCLPIIEVHCVSVHLDPRWALATGKNSEISVIPKLNLLQKANWTNKNLPVPNKVWYWGRFSGWISPEMWNGMNPTDQISLMDHLFHFQIRQSSDVPNNYHPALFAPWESIWQAWANHWGWDYNLEKEEKGSSKLNFLTAIRTFQSFEYFWN